MGPDKCVFVGRFDSGANRHLVRTDSQLIPDLALMSAFGGLSGQIHAVTGV